MERVVSFTPADILAWCGFIITVATAIGLIAGLVAKAIAAAKKPNQEQDDRISALETTVEKHERLLGSDNKRLQAIEEGNRVTQKAILALLDHGLDGNNIAQMQQAKIDLQNHLIER